MLHQPRIACAVSWVPLYIPIRLSTPGFRDRALQHQLLIASIVVVAALLARR
jgi:hypothetical protein